MNRGGAETLRMKYGYLLKENRREAEALRINDITERVIGLLINFNVPVLTRGLKRIVNNYYESKL